MVRQRITYAALSLALGTGACREAPVTSAPQAIALPPIPADRPGVFADQLDVTVMQRGNLHTHSRESDGDSPPERVYAFYRDHGYNFLALTDHNRRTDPDLYRALERPGFVILPGEEVTMSSGGAQVHVNALCHRRMIGEKKRTIRFATVQEALAWGAARVVEQGGVALVNHPNFYWSFGAAELPAARGARLLEIWTGYLTAYPDGDASRPSVEAMWDDVLSRGHDFAAVAVDDMHNLGAPRESTQPGPARGWVEVFAASASEAEICDALRRGRLVASTGPRIERLAVRGDAITVVTSAAGTVEFVGAGGAVLSRQDVVPGQENVYRLAGGERYVRARVRAADGTRAWTQAYRVTY